MGLSIKLLSLLLLNALLVVPESYAKAPGARPSKSTSRIGSYARAKYYELLMRNQKGAALRFKNPAIQKIAEAMPAETLRNLEIAGKSPDPAARKAAQEFLNREFVRVVTEGKLNLTEGDIMGSRSTKPNKPVKSLLSLGLSLTGRNGKLKTGNLRELVETLARQSGAEGDAQAYREVGKEIQRAEDLVNEKGGKNREILESLRLIEGHLGENYGREVRDSLTNRELDLASKKELLRTLKSLEKRIRRKTPATSGPTARTQEQNRSDLAENVEAVLDSVLLFSPKNEMLNGVVFVRGLVERGTNNVSLAGLRELVKPTLDGFEIGLRKLAREKLGDKLTEEQISQMSSRELRDKLVKESFEKEVEQLKREKLTELQEKYKKLVEKGILTQRELEYLLKHCVPNSWVCLSCMRRLVVPAAGATAVALTSSSTASASDQKSNQIVEGMIEAAQSREVSDKQAYDRAQRNSVPTQEVVHKGEDAKPVVTERRRRR